MSLININNISLDKPVLIAGPTASGKSGLALEIAQRTGGIIVNADALQVYDNWQVLTARPDPSETSLAPHALYGHVAADQEYSVGHWLRDVEQIKTTGQPLIIVGGTGLYFRALTEGLVDIPPPPKDVRATADAHRLSDQVQSMIDALDPRTKARIDLQNPMRVQRAWEVQTATGRGLADWQDATPAPLIALADATALVLDAPKHWLTPRISLRFDRMLDGGALDEVRANAPGYTPDLPSAKAIGAPELMAWLNGETTLEAAKDAAILATVQYAKRQRTWFNARMKNWRWVECAP